LSEDHYIIQVDEFLNTLRVKLLGQDLPYESILPSAFQTKNDAVRCAHLSEQMTFALAKMLPELQGTLLAAAQSWLYEALLFLTTRCNDEDHTFASIIRVISLPEDTRMLMFGDAASTYPHLCYEEAPPFSSQELQSALLNLAAGIENLESKFEKVRLLLT